MVTKRRKVLPRFTNARVDVERLLLDDYMISSPDKWQKDHACVIYPGDHGVQTEITATMYKQLKADPRFVESLMLHPGCGPSYYLHRADHPFAKQYTVTIRYPLRDNPDDPIDF